MKTARLRDRSRLALVLATAFALVVILATSAGADHAYIEISIPVDTVVRAPEDSTTQLGAADVPEGFADHFCDVRAHAENQTSIHPGNDLLVESGNSQVLLSDVESESGKVIETEQMLELGEVIEVSLIMGPDEVFSAGIEVVVECVPEETTTTIPTTTTAEVLPTEITTSTTVADTTTTAEVLDTEITAPDTSTTSSIEDEVKGTEVLPFTGSENPEIGLIALALVVSGVLLLAGTRRTDD